MKGKNVFAIISMFLILAGCGSNEANKKTVVVQPSKQVQNQQGLTPVTLHQSALDGQKSEVIRLLAEGTDVNMIDHDGRTSLMYASYNGHTEIANELLKKGAEINICDNFGRTALMFASSGPFQETVKLLLQNKANPNIADLEKHFTALMYAAAEGQQEVIKLLLAYSADPSLKDIDGNDAATFALKNGHNEVADVIKSFVKMKNVKAK